MMRVASKSFADGNVPEDLGVYLLHSMDASAKVAVKAVMDRNGLALDLGNDKTMQYEGIVNQSVCYNLSSYLMLITLLASIQ